MKLNGMDTGPWHLCNKNKVALKSRNDKSFNEKFYPIHQAVKKWNINAVVDGEVVVLDENGKSNFGALQNWRSEADGEIYFYVFDMLMAGWKRPDGSSLSRAAGAAETNYSLQ